MAAMSVIRAKGYSATTVDDLCQAADVTKGGFFHHFKSKDELALAAAAQMLRHGRRHQRFQASVEGVACGVPS